MSDNQFDKKHASFAGRLVIIGFGSIGQGVLPLILRHIDIPVDRIRIVSFDANLNFELTLEKESTGARTAPP